jgi:hypothetical protein
VQICVRLRLIISVNFDWKVYKTCGQSETPNSSSIIGVMLGPFLTTAQSVAENDQNVSRGDKSLVLQTFQFNSVVVTTQQNTPHDHPQIFSSRQNQKHYIQLWFSVFNLYNNRLLP